MKVLFAVAVSAFLTGGVFAAEALKFVKRADFKGYLSCVKEIENGIRVTNKGKYMYITSVKQFTVDPKKKYRISCEYRLVPGSKTTGKFYLGTVAYDSKGRIISAVSQNCVGGSDTVLAAAAKKGDKVITVKNGAKWVLQYGYASFNTKAKFTDLPNFDVVPITGINKKGTVWEISLKTPLTHAYPAGTAVREHRAGASYRYILTYVHPKEQWQKCSRILSGEIREGSNGSGAAWRIGTKKSGITFFIYGPLEMELRNLCVEEVK